MIPAGGGRLAPACNTLCHSASGFGNASAPVEYLRLRCIGWSSLHGETPSTAVSAYVHSDYSKVNYRYS